MAAHYTGRHHPPTLSYSPRESDFGGYILAFSLAVAKPQTPSHLSWNRLIHLDALLLQIRSRQVNLPHQLAVRSGDVVECEHAVAELEKEVCAEGHERPDGDLERYGQTSIGSW